MRPAGGSRRLATWLLAVAVACASGTAAGQTIRTIAGGAGVVDGTPAATASLAIGAVAIAPDGTVHVIDNTARILRLDASGKLRVVAGTGEVGFSPDGALARESRLNGPVSLAFDGSGNLYVAEYAEPRVRKIRSDGRLETVAGNGVSAYAGDGGPATQASFKSPQRILLDGRGGLLILDPQDYRLRRVDLATGRIATVAGSGTQGTSGGQGDGGPATLAAIRNLTGGLAVDAPGNLYVSEAGRIRRVNTSGVITTIAGNSTFASAGDGGPATAAQLANNGLGIYPNGDLLLSENGRFRKISAATGIITTVAGNGLAGYGGDGGPATAASLYGSAFEIDAQGNALLVGPAVLRRFEFAANHVTRILGNGVGDGGPATSALVAATDVAVGPDGSLWFTQLATVRRIDPAGIVSTRAGSDTATTSGDGGPSTLAQLVAPNGIAVDRQGNVYVADTGAHRVRRIDAATSTITTVAGTGEPAFGGDGGPATLARLRNPRDVSVDAFGNLLVSDTGNCRVRFVSPGGGISTVAGNGSCLAASGGINPFSIGTDAAGNVFFYDFSDNRIKRLSRPFFTLENLAGNGGRGFSGDGGAALDATFNPAAGLIGVDDAGNVLLADSGNNRVRLIDAATRRIQTVAGTGTRVFSGDGGPATAAGMLPTAISWSAGGSYLVGGNSRIRAVSPCRAPDAPTLAAPADGTSNAAAQLTLSWNAAPGASRYDVLLDGTPSPAKVLAADVAGTSYTVANLAPGVRHYWKVVAKADPFCTPAQPSASSAVRSFTTSGSCGEPGAAALSGPAAGATDVPLNATLSWQSAAGASAYDVFLGTSSPPAPVSSGQAGTTYGASLAPATTYYWQVLARAACDGARTKASEVRSFRTTGSCASAGTFALSSPANGATNVAVAATLAWTASPGASSYDVYLGTAADPPLFRSGVSATSLAVSGLSPGATYAWRVAANVACDPTKTVRSAVSTFRVTGTCAAPASTQIVFVPPGNVSVGQTYAVAWRPAAGLDAGGAYVVQRSADIAFGSILDSQTVTDTSATFVAPAAGRFYHRVRAIAGCDPTRAGPDSDPRSVTVVAGTPNVVFSVPPPGVVTKLGSPVEESPTSLVLENVGTDPVRVQLAQQYLSSSDGDPTAFFILRDTQGQPLNDLLLAPKSPRRIEVQFQGADANRARGYLGVVVVFRSDFSPLAVTPHAIVSLKVGGEAAPPPRFAIGGSETEQAIFPGFAGDDANRPPLTIEIRNPGGAPIELAAEIEPEAWLEPEAGWNAAPIAGGATRSVKLFTKRSRAPSGAAFPRHTYFTVRTRDGASSRLLVVDPEQPAVVPGRTAPAPGSDALVVPSVVNATSAIGNSFVSRVTLSNGGGEAVSAELVFTPSGADGFDANAVRSVALVVPPNDVVTLSDPVGRLFGVAPPSAGSLEVRTPPDRSGFLTVGSAVEAPSKAGGTFGFVLPVFKRGDGARLGRPWSVTGLTANAAQRTNLILAETTGVEATDVRVTLWNSAGTKLGEAATTVPRLGQRQLSGILAALSGGATLTGATLDVEVVSGGGAVAAVATVIDNVNDDASAIPGKAAPTGASAALRAKLPGWAKAAGTLKLVVPAVVNGFQTFPGTAKPYTFQSSMALTSVSAQPATFRLSYRDLQTGSVTEKTVTVGARATQTYDNVLEQLFGVDPGGRSQGPVFVEADPNGVVSARVFSKLDSGALGDAFPVVAIPASTLTGLSSATPIQVDGLEQSVDPTRGSRSNLILNEVIGQPAVVTVRLYEAGNRSRPIAEADVSLQGLEKVQLSTVFSGLGLATEDRLKDRTNVLCSVVAKSGSGLVSAVVTTIDNKTGDTRNILLAPAGGGGSAIGF